MPWTNLGILPVWTPWGNNDPDQPVKADDAAHDRDLRVLFTHALDNNEPPNVFKLSEVSDTLSKRQLAHLGYETPRDAIPALRVMAFEFRDMGYCDVIYRGYIVPEDVGLEDIEGPIRVRRRMKHEMD